MPATTLPSSLVPALTGHNLLINARFEINQRAYVSGTNTVGSNQYTVDRWRVVTSGQNLTLSAGVATAPAGGIEQVVEGLNIPVTGSYVLSWTGAATATVNGSAVTNGSTVVLAAGANVTVRFSGGAVSFPQLELGSVATAFDHQHIATTLARCLRYYEKSYDMSFAPGAVTSAGAFFGHRANGGSTLAPRYQVRKRTAATPVVYSPVTGAQSQLRNYHSAADQSSSVSFVGETGFNVTSVSAAVHDLLGCHWVCDAEI